MELGEPTVLKIQAQVTIRGLKEVVPFVPVIGDVSNVVSVIRNPSIIAVTAAVIGAVPEVGAIGSDVIKMGRRRSVKRNKYL